MKKLVLAALVAAGVWYGILVPRAWHADDAASAAPYRFTGPAQPDTQTAHKGAVILGIAPALVAGIAILCWWKASKE